MHLKHTIKDLAVFGGTSSFAKKLHVGRPNISNRESFSNKVNDILDRYWLSNNGKYVKQFENELAFYVGVKHCIVVTNATIALEIAVRALELTGEVILPSFTFIASAHALQWQDIKPVFCDIDPETYNIDHTKIDKLVTSNTSAILGVHVYGRPCDCLALEHVARKHNLKLIYDAAHAFGCSYNGKMIGHFGELEVFSFHATKFLNSLEGGAIVTNNDELEKRIRSMINFGFTNYDRVDSVGTNGKMNEVSAAMGLTNLENIDELIDKNLSNYKLYQQGLNGVAGIRLITFDESQNNNYQYVVIEVDESESGISRNILNIVLNEENVLTRRYFYPGCHLMEPYQSQNPEIGMHLPVTEQITQKVLCLPTGTGIEPHEILSICELIRFIVGKSDDITKKLS